VKNFLIIILINKIGIVVLGGGLATTPLAVKINWSQYGRKR